MKAQGLHLLLLRMPRVNLTETFGSPKTKDAKRVVLQLRSDFVTSPKNKSVVRNR
jgi:hypothetical protein